MTTAEERAKLLKFGRPLGDGPSLVVDADSAVGKPTKKGRPGGRPRIDDNIRALIVKLARESSMAYTRILGELRSLGIRGKICRQTVKNVLREEGIDTGTSRSETTRDYFLRRHAKTLWAADFFIVRTWTMRGLVDCCALVFMHVDTKWVFLSLVTVQPDQKWVNQQARNFLLEIGDDAKGTVLIHDRDTKFQPSFDGILRSEAIVVKTLPVRSPDLNAHVERFV